MISASKCSINGWEEHGNHRPAVGAKQAAIKSQNSIQKKRKTFSLLRGIKQVTLGKPLDSTPSGHGSLNYETKLRVEDKPY